MNIGIAVVVILLVAFIVLRSIISLTLKIISLGILIIAVALTVWICIAQPELHKPLSLNAIEYLFKINKDGSITTTKQITQTVLIQDGEQ